MPKAIVLNTLLSASDKQRVTSLLVKGQFEASFDPLSVSEIDLDNDVVVVCLPIDEREMGAVSSHIDEFTTAGAIVIAIWLDENADDILPTGIDQLGSAAVSIDAPEAVEALSGASIWQAPSGAKRQQKSARRNC